MYPQASEERLHSSAKSTKANLEKKEIGFVSFILYPKIDSQWVKYLNGRSETYIFEIKIHELTLTLICKYDLGIISKH